MNYNFLWDKSCGTFTYMYMYLSLINVIIKARNTGVKFITRNKDNEK